MKDFSKQEFSNEFVYEKSITLCKVTKWIVDNLSASKIEFNQFLTNLCKCVNDVNWMI